LTRAAFFDQPLDARARLMFDFIPQKNRHFVEVQRGFLEQVIAQRL
jgi:hypothetical protein